MLRELRRAHPGTAILYVDLYDAVADLIASPRKYGTHHAPAIISHRQLIISFLLTSSSPSVSGFRDEPLAACCGAYNFNMTAFCGAAGTAACADPSEYVSWDGVHFTEAANRHTACATLKTNSPALLDSWTAEARQRIGCA
uniref:GDSL esterase/lipase n=2 Tax=Aegilops tauschii TaxID=37682 RepID=M8B2V3_AEGTA